MVNSRTRSRPARGRASSRNLVWNWYHTCGSCLCDLQLLGEQREDLLVGHAEHVHRALVVGDPEHDVAHRFPAAAALPDLRRVHGRQQHLLAAERFISSRMMSMILARTRTASGSSE